MAKITSPSEVDASEGSVMKQAAYKRLHAVSSLSVSFSELILRRGTIQLFAANYGFVTGQITSIYDKLVLL